MLGLSAWKAGDRETAVNAFTLALEKDSTHVKSHLNLSRVLIEQGHAQEALPHVAAALAIDSTSSEGFRLLGRVKSELSDSDGAIAAYKRAIVLDGRDAWSLNNLARVYMGQGRFEDALGPLARAIEIDSTVAAFPMSGSSARASSAAARPCHLQIAAATAPQVIGKSSIAASTFTLASASSAPFAMPVATKPTARYAG